MKLLFDQNLSPKLCKHLSDHFPESKHLQEFNLDKAFDDEVWNFAKRENFTIVTKDIDFTDLSFYRGFPPKIIWLKKGTCSTKDIFELIFKNKSLIIDFIVQNENGILILE